MYALTIIQTNVAIVFFQIDGTYCCQNCFFFFWIYPKSSRMHPVFLKAIKFSDVGRFLIGFFSSFLSLHWFHHRRSGFLFFPDVLEIYLDTESNIAFVTAPKSFSPVVLGSEICTRKCLLILKWSPLITTNYGSPRHVSSEMFEGLYAPHRINPAFR